MCFLSMRNPGYTHFGYVQVSIFCSAHSVEYSLLSYDLFFLLFFFFSHILSMGKMCWEHSASCVAFGFIIPMFALHANG